MRFSKLVEFLWNFWDGLDENDFQTSCIASHVHYNIALGLSPWCLYYCISHAHAFFMYTYLQFFIFWYIDCVGAFLRVFLSPFLLLLVSCIMAPKQKYTPSRNPLRSEASTSFDPTPSHVWFHDEKAKSDFFKNFSRWGVHSERQVILSDFFDTDLPTIIHSRDLGVTLWRLNHLSIHADTGFLLQHVGIWLFSTSFCYSRSRYLHYGYSRYCIRRAACPEGRAFWLPWLWSFENCVQIWAHILF